MNSSSSMSTDRPSYDSFDFLPLPFDCDDEFYGDVQDEDLHFFTFNQHTSNGRQSKQVVQEVKWFWKQSKQSNSSTSSCNHLRWISIEDGPLCAIKYNKYTKK